MSRRVPVVAKVPPEWLAAIDAAAADRGWTRSEWIARVIERGLIGAGYAEAPERVVGSGS